ncbi:MAG TPA: hypothetical protein VIF57_03175 [Polyangia bacterium]|jgi:hypothetical protein
MKLRLLVTRDFGLLWLGEALSQIGDSLNRVALLWLAYQTTGWRTWPSPR